MDGSEPLRNLAESLIQNAAGGIEFINICESGRAAFGKAFDNDENAAPRVNKLINSAKVTVTWDD